MNALSPPSARSAVMAAAPFARMSQLLLRTYVLATLLCLPVTNAVFVSFQDCLPSNRNPGLLQFTPLFVDARFDETLPNHALNFTIYGNVSGQYYDLPLPPPNSSYWTNSSETAGKIEDIGSGNRYTTLTAQYDVVTYTAARNPGQRFCQSLLNASGSYPSFDCPLAPVFNYTGVNGQPNELPAIFLSQDMNGTYAFSTISSTVHVLSGDASAFDYACISAQVTPALGSSISSLITWLPAAILIIKGLATLAAAIYSPWGSADIFRWSSNYGRDEDLLRLVTPGFGDCLQYIQFVVLTGALSVQYPGFYQPAVRQAAWSTLLFNESYVSGGAGTRSLVDGIYQVNGTYGMARMSQLIGMTTPNDIWACMAIWLLVIAGSVVVLCQLGFFLRYCYRKITSTSEEDLRKKNLPFTLGNMIRLLFNFFILPIVALSLFQLVISPDMAPSSVIACAAVLLGIMIVSAGWILRVIFTTKPRTSLFDDMPTVLLYGPLYNTYSDSAAPFALIPVFITFMRGVALGAVQPSGIAQIILLAICEVILILTLNGFRPFQGQTSMNLYHTVFASVRLATVLLMIAFVPSLSVDEAPKGWIGYTILVMHACVLVFGFFLNSAQTLVEVLARAMGAGGGDNANDAIRGSILNWRMLKKRQTRGNAGAQADRASTMSTAAMLGRTSTGGHPALGGRSRSISASSQQLLGGRTSGFDNLSTTTGLDPLGSPDLEGENAMPFGYGRTSKDHGGETGYYRAPRPRKATMDTMSPAVGGGVTPGGKTRSSSYGGADFLPYRDAPTHSREASYDPDHMPAAAYFRERQLSDGGNTVVGAGGARTDYAVREVDQYYRGQALNDQPTRKLKTGPADPEGPAIAAQSWFTKLLFGVQGGKKKDAGKGFEVVRSSRMPPEMQAAANRAAAAEDLEMQETTPPLKEQYFDQPAEATRSPGKDGITATGMVPADEMDGEGAERRELLSPPSPETNRNTRIQSFDFGFDGSAERPATTYGATDTFRPDSETVTHPAIFASGDRQSAATVATAATLSAPFDAALSRQSRETDISNYDAQSSLYGDDQSVEHTAVARRVTMRPSLDPVALVGGRDLAAHPLTLSTDTPTSAGSRLSPVRPGQPDNRLSAAASSIAPSDIGKSTSGQDWLRAVETLGWNQDEARLSTSTLVPGGQEHNPQQITQQRISASPTSPYQTSAFPLPPQQSSAPAVPERNSRRGTVTQDSMPSEYLAYINSSSSRPTSPGYRVISPMSQESDHPRTGFSQHKHQASESSFTSSVNHHRAADSITRNSFGANVAMQASRAEYFGGGDRSPTPSELGDYDRERGGFI